MTDTRALKSQFVGLTGASTSVAQYWLSKYQWDLNAAMDGYFAKASAGGNGAKNVRKLAEIFDRYKDPDTGHIGVDGTIQYIEDLGFDPEDPVALVLAYTLDSPKTGVFEYNSFITGWNKQRIYTLQEMSDFLQKQTENLANSTEYLQKLYEYTFGFILEEPQKKISLDEAKLYWELLLSKRFSREISLWNEYIDQEWKKPISRDAWNMLFLFLVEFQKDPLLKDYDENAAWPGIIDGFVEYLKENNRL